MKRKRTIRDNAPSEGKVSTSILGCTIAECHVAQGQVAGIDNQEAKPWGVGGAAALNDGSIALNNDCSANVGQGGITPKTIAGKIWSGKGVGGTLGEGDGIVGAIAGVSVANCCG